MEDCLEQPCGVLSTRECREFYKNKPYKGTYVGVKYDKGTLKQIRELTNLLNVPNVVSRDKLHSTVIYSRTKINVPYTSKDVNYLAWTKNLEIWEDNDKNILVLKIDSPSLKRRHEELLSVGGTSDYPEYNTHITLSYDIGDWEIPPDSARCICAGFVLNIKEEYAEELNFDWSDK